MPVNPNPKEFLAGDSIFPGILLVDKDTGLPYNAGPGGGGGVSDTVFIDSDSQLFVYRDTGSATPVAYSIPDWTVYTPVAPVSYAGMQTSPIGLTLSTDVTIANDGSILDLGRYPPAIAYNAAGSVSSLTYNSSGVNFIQTWNYDSAGNFIGATVWVRQ